MTAVAQVALLLAPRCGCMTDRDWTIPCDECTDQAIGIVKDLGLRREFHIQSGSCCINVGTFDCRCTPNGATRLTTPWTPPTDQPGGQAGDTGDDMCPNCVTPWKCNGPHWGPVDQADQ